MTRREVLLAAHHRQEACELAVIVRFLDPDVWSDTDPESLVAIITHWMALRWLVRYERLEP